MKYHYILSSQIPSLQEYSCHSNRTCNQQ